MRAVLTLALGMALAAMLATVARAESEGPYVHGQLRVDDKDVLICFEPYRDEALLIASLYITYVLNGLNEDGSEYRRFSTALDIAVKEKKCFFIAQLTHRSIRTIYQGPKNIIGDDRWSVVKSRAVGRDKEYDLYVITGEDVPPVPSELRCIDRGTC